MNILKKIFSILAPGNKLKMESNQEEQNAYHESGHILMAYLSGFTCENVTLLQDGSGNAFTKFNYGNYNINILIAAIVTFNEDSEMYNSLPANLKSQTQLAAIKIGGTLLGGSVAEHLFKSGSDFKGQLEIEISGPDLTRVLSINSLLSSLNSKTHDINYIANELERIALIFQQENVWNSIEMLSKEILLSPTKSLSQKQIEESLNTTGYLEYIK
ncbi:hypothetical protein [Pedobacter cryophilus]|uniref:Peptidase M41 domain-containing protein n=1 Tax=Pedobacter cryophilus TaxID=2571271 RepID=A0A4V5NX85_9SPHI|nr:hypothetical protein [Pedobacter cryophilus]TKB96960.1 hypothetical protein FA046_12890 [Pedobacter cryophilus]